MVFWKMQADSEVMLFLNIRCMVYWMLFLKSYNPNLLMLFSVLNDWTSDCVSDPFPLQGFFHVSLDDRHKMIDDR